MKNTYSPEIRQRAVRLYQEQRSEYPTQWAATVSIASKFGCTPETLRTWIKKFEADLADNGAAADQAQRIKQLERDNKELQRANEILRKAAAFFAQAEARPQIGDLLDFIHEHKMVYGVESICRVLPIAPSTYYRHAQRLKQPDLRAKRCVSDECLLVQINTVWEDSLQVYGYRKVWHQLQREGVQVARCTVARLMRKHSIQGVWRGKGKRTTVCDPELQRADDLVNRQFTASRPNQLWVADFTYVSTHQGFVYSAFIIDVFARRIVGWKVAKRMDTDLVMDALEQALHARNKPKHLIHHSDRGSQYLSIRYTERLQAAQVKASVGTTGDSYDNALAETVNGLYKTEVIHHQKPWKRMIDVELATLNWVDWFNHRRLLSSIGYVPPAEFEMAYYRQLEEPAKVA